MSRRLVDPDQAAYEAYVLTMAANRARAEGSMVIIDGKNAQYYPASCDYEADMELIEWPADSQKSIR